MGKYRNIPIVIEATQWFKKGDHSQVLDYSYKPNTNCNWCGKPTTEHGWIKTPGSGHIGGYIVCPGDWIIEDIKGEFHKPCKPNIFEATYEEEKPES